jgi:hypothetical protein
VCTLCEFRSAGPSPSWTASRAASPACSRTTPACATCGPARPPKSHRPLDRLNQLAPEAGPFGADADLVAEVLDQVQVGKVTLSWSAAGTVAESPEQDRLHRLVEAGVLWSSKEPALHPGRRLISCSGHPICP